MDQYFLEVSKLLKKDYSSLFIYLNDISKISQAEKFINKNKDTYGFIDAYIFFKDYITETTTFVRYHNQYRFDYMFGGKFKLQFIKNCVSSLIAFGDSIGIKWLMVSLLRSTFDMLYIRKLSV